MMKKLQTGIYSHYKGKKYEVLGVVKHSETLEPMALYKAMYDSTEFGPNALWVRPLELFLEKINVGGGKEQPRFEFIEFVSEQLLFVSSHTKKIINLDINQLQTGIYRHYKGKEYEVFDVVKHSETLEPMVLYKALYDSTEFGPNALWVRPLRLFLENVNVDDKEQPRFEYVSEKLTTSSKINLKIGGP